jgi:hypothetical protein
MVELYRLPKVISEKVGEVLPDLAANWQACPTFSEMTVGNHSNVLSSGVWQIGCQSDGTGVFTLFSNTAPDGNDRALEP